MTYTEKIKEEYRLLPRHDWTSHQEADWWLEKIHQALAEEKEKVRESAGNLRKDHARYMETDTFFEVQEVEDIAKEAYNKALDDILASLDKTLIDNLKE